MKSNNIDKKQVVKRVQSVVESNRNEFPILGKLNFFVYDIDDTSCFINAVFKCEANVYKLSVLREECRRLIFLLYARIPDLIELGFKMRILDVQKDADITFAFVSGLTIIDSDFFLQVN